MQPALYPFDRRVRRARPWYVCSVFMAEPGDRRIVDESFFSRNILASTLVPQQNTRGK